jgi:hypothetical protein
MSVITTGAHPKALWPGVYKWTHLKYRELPMQLTDIFGEMRSSEKNYEETVEATGFGLAQQKPQGGAVSYDTHSQGPTTRYTHVAYGLGYIVTKEELDDNQYAVLARSRSTALAFSFRQTKEIVAANVLNRAFDANFAGGDGAALISTGHSVAAGGTQSNRIAINADLSEAALEDLLIQISQARNNRGLNIRLTARKLIVHPSNVFDAIRIVNSTLRPGTANNDVNAMAYMGMLPDGVKVNNYLDDEEAFYLITDAPDSLMGFERVAFQFSRDNDFDTENAKAKGYERYSFGWSDFRGIYGSQGG